MTARSSLERVEAALGALGEFPSWQGGERMRVRGVCHDGQKPDTLAIRYEPAMGRVLVYCHGGCDAETIAGALGLRLADFYDEAGERSGLRLEPVRPARRGPPAAVTVFDPAPAGWRPLESAWVPCGHGKLAEYVYVDERGRVVFGVTRCPRKCFAQWRPDPSRRGGRRWRLRETDRSGAVIAEVRPVLYRLPALLAAVGRGKRVWLVEGEKDADACAAHGLAATTASRGANGWRPEYTAQLAGAHVCLVADRDVPGRRRAEKVVAALRGHVASLDVVVAADGCKDPYDHFAAGCTAADFLTVWTPLRAGIETP